MGGNRVATRLLLSAEEVGKVLGLSRPRVYELGRLGLLPGVVRLGRSVFFTRQGLELLLGGAIGDAPDFCVGEDEGVRSENRGHPDAR